MEQGLPYWKLWLVMQDLGKTLVVIGLVLALVGGAILLAGRVGLPLGRLPGDFSYKGKNVSFYFLLGTSILISVVLSALLYFISRVRR
jgi:hypothetical protein